MRASLLASAIAARCGATGLLAASSGFEPVTFPVLDPDQHNPCRLHEQKAQVRLPRLEILRGSCGSPVEICLGTSPEPGPKSRPLENTSPVPIAATMALEMIGPMPGTVIKARTCLILTASASISPDRPSMRDQPAPVACQVLDDTQHAWRQGIGARRKDGGQFRAQEADTLATRRFPRSSMKARIW